MYKAGDQYRPQKHVNIVSRQQHSGLSFYSSTPGGWGMGGAAACKWCSVNDYLRCCSKTTDLAGDKSKHH